jgi:predicted nucleotidyltransferase component of viral defense system
MIELFKEKLRKLEAQEHRNNYLRELLQIMVLSALSNKNYFHNIAFIGGTALRIIYETQRYSEDLDFSLVSGEIDFDQLLEDIANSFKNLGIEAEIKKSKPKTVHSAFIKFSGVLQALDKKVHHQEKLQIKIEIDSNPPLGYNTTETFINNFVSFPILHFDKASLFAGKLHAITQRKYTKGRDYYDLLWYLGQRFKPNWIQLNNSLEQTTGTNPNWGPPELEEKLLNVMATTDFEKVKEDLAGFLIDKKNNEYMNKEHMTAFVKSYFNRTYI